MSSTQAPVILVPSKKDTIYLIKDLEEQAMQHFYGLCIDLCKFDESGLDEFVTYHLGKN